MSQSTQCLGSKVRHLKPLFKPRRDKLCNVSDSKSLFLTFTPISFFENIYVHILWGKHFATTKPTSWWTFDLQTVLAIVMTLCLRGNLFHEYSIPAFILNICHIFQASMSTLHYTVRPVFVPKTWFKTLSKGWVVFTQILITFHLQNLDQA